ncbi:PrsW family intramembrane metalloprotease [Nonomuraea sp. NPDC046570]|uniref:PrsW family intramembrane metalloprotease n=1 Tax=Nonomuraea sp. NPDC046570 TaxID=3155255 RepID=UPI0033EFC2C5
MTVSRETYRPPVLPRRPSRTLIAALVISGLVALFILAAMLLSGGPADFGLSALLAVGPLPVLLAAVLALDRLEPEPRLHLVFAFVWGGGIAVALAILLTILGEGMFAGVGLAAQRVNDVGLVVVAPVVEEALKGSALLLLLRRRREIDGLTDGIIYAAMAGLGFAAVENVGYYLAAFQADGTNGALTLFVLRGLVAPLGHPVYTAMIGIGVAYAVTRSGPGRYAAVPLGYLAAVLLHGLWNGMAVLSSPGGLAIVYFLLLAVIIVLVVVTVRERKQLLARIGAYLPLYEATGLVTAQDVGMLGSLGARRRARRRAGRAMGDYQQAATELAMLHQRAERGGMDLEEFGAERDALLSVMASARAAMTPT